MCGRFSQAYTWEEIHQFSQPLTLERSNLQPHYNVSPTDQIDIIVRDHDGNRTMIKARWGLVPPKHKGPLKGLPPYINARVETVDTNYLFRYAFQEHRCIIPASGFFEWTGEKGNKSPHYFSADDGSLLGFAGLWERWTNPEGDDMISATIIVREADSWTKVFHDRMPAMINPADFDKWLDGSAGKELLEEPSRKLKEWIVSQRMNRAGQGDNDSETVEPVDQKLF